MFHTRYISPAQRAVTLKHRTLLQHPLWAALRLRPLAILADLHCARGGSEKVSRTGRHPTSRGSQPRPPDWAALRLRPLAILADLHCARGGSEKVSRTGRHPTSRGSLPRVPGWAALRLRPRDLPIYVARVARGAREHATTPLPPACRHAPPPPLVHGRVCAAVGVIIPFSSLS